MEAKVQKKKRTIINPIKKWTKPEVLQILDYIINEGNFEKPTAQVFYAKLVKNTHINVTWNLVKWKMRNLKRAFQKAMDWENSTDTALLDDEACLSVKEKVLKICPHFDLLSQIFGEKNNIDRVTFYEGVEDVTSESSNAPVIESELGISEFVNTENLHLLSTCSTSKNNTLDSDTSISQPKQLKSDIPKSAQQPTTMHRSEIMLYFNKKVEIETRKLDLEEKKIQKELSLQAEKQQQELEFKKKEIELQEMQLKLKEKKMDIQKEKQTQKFELKKMELERDERIAKMELELKYKKTGFNSF